MSFARTYLNFERPIAELDSKIETLLELKDEAVDVSAEIAQLREKSVEQLTQLYQKIGPWEKTQVARHPLRPHFTDYRKGLITDFTPLAGDRKFGEDHALMGGLGRLGGRPVVVMGHEKGDTTEKRLIHNFGMSNPEGYRKAVRLMELAERFDLPVVSFVDTAGAFPGRGAEERGQAEAIARSIDKGLSITSAFVSVISGEGGSGGAIAIATADSVLMLEHSIYSVISPEGCASILWRDGARAKDAAKAMKITAQDLKSFGVIDGIIEEPIGGAHRDRADMISRVGERIGAELDRLAQLPPAERVKLRKEKFLNIGRSLLG